MSTGYGFAGEALGADDQSPKVGAGDAAGRGDDGTFADVLNGFSLDSGRSRRKSKKNRKSQESVAAWLRVPASPTALPSTDQGGRVTPVVSPPANHDIANPIQGGLFDAAYRITGHGVPADDDLLYRGEETASVRPYTLTGGRTKSNYALELETLVSTKGNAAEGAFEAAVEQIESRSIMEECRSPRSVAEIAAVLRVPLGVARVLISDAADAGLVAVHKTIYGNGGAEAQFVLMERVLSGLRRL